MVASWPDVPSNMKLPFWPGVELANAASPPLMVDESVVSGGTS